MSPRLEFAPLELEGLLRDQMGSRVSNLAVAVEGDDLVLSGNSPTFYVKQLAQELIRAVQPLRALRNNIVVAR
jgi:hypothetical protein